MGARSKRGYKITSVSWGEDGKGEGEGKGGGGKGCRDAATTFVVLPARLAASRAPVVTVLHNDG